MTTATVAPVRISGDGLVAHIEVAGADVSNHVTGATLRLRAGRPAELTLEFVGVADVTELGSTLVEYVAYAAGESAHGPDMVSTLRQLADKIEAQQR